MADKTQYIEDFVVKRVKVGLILDFAVNDADRLEAWIWGNWDEIASGSNVQADCMNVLIWREPATGDVRLAITTTCFGITP